MCSIFSCCEVVKDISYYKLCYVLHTKQLAKPCRCTHTALAIRPAGRARVCTILSSHNAAELLLNGMKAAKSTEIEVHEHRYMG